MKTRVKTKIFNENFYRTILSRKKIQSSKRKTTSVLGTKNRIRRR
jgi:hypothetical protein